MSRMEGYLQEIVQCAISKVLLDKLTFVEDICFNADINIAVDKTETFSFKNAERILKSNTELHQQQFNLLFGNKSRIALNYGNSDISTQTDIPSDKLNTDMQTQTNPTVKVETCTQTNYEEDVMDKQEKISSEQANNAGTNETQMQHKTQMKVLTCNAEVQTDNVVIKPETTKRRQRKPTRQRKKIKNRAEAVNPVKDNSDTEVEPVEIKLEIHSDPENTDPVSDVGSDVEEVTVVPPQPPTEVQNNTESDDITCPLCPARFSSQKSAENHLRVKHDIGNVYVCQVCQEICPSRAALHEHLMAFHGIFNEEEEPPPEPKPAPKKKRGRKPNQKKSTKVKTMPVKKKAPPKAPPKKSTPKRSKGDLKITLKSTGKNQYVKNNLKCSQCPKEYTSRRALTRHIKTAHEDKKYQCDVCGKVFTSKETLYHHRRGIHSENKPYTCNECGASFNFNHSLRLHKLKHSGDRPYQCNECHKTYLTSNHLKMHVDGVHGGKKSHSCKICGKSFSYTTSLKVHEMSHGDNRPYKCTVCGQGFINSHSLKYHKESKHALNTWFHCDICGKKYKTEFLMKTHRRRHTADGSRYMCDICGRQFMYKSTLDIHAAVHSEEKSYQCSTCGKSFKTYATLYSHQYVHKSDSPFNCPDCGKAFKTKERCKAHQRRHSGLKPFECEQCGRCFPDKGGLSKHTKTVHCEIKKFVCEVCGKACSRADNLRVHMKIHNKHLEVMLPGQPKSSKRSSNVSTLSTDQTNKGMLKSEYDASSARESLKDFLSNSPDDSPPPSMALPRVYQDRIEPPPFIPNSDTLSGHLHVMPLTSQESDMNTAIPQANSNPLIQQNVVQSSASPYMYMWPYLHQSNSQHHEQSGPSNQFY